MKENSYNIININVNNLIINNNSKNNNNNINKNQGKVFSKIGNDIIDGKNLLNIDAKRNKMKVIKEYNNQKINNPLLKKPKDKYDYENIQKEMTEHFQNEINLKKKIIEKEEIIENLKNELADKENEYFHSNKANHRLLKGEVESKRDDIKEKPKKKKERMIHIILEALWMKISEIWNDFII